jgi:hypothetical protein
MLVTAQSAALYSCYRILSRRRSREAAASRVSRALAGPRASSSSRPIASRVPIHSSSSTDRMVRNDSGKRPVTRSRMPASCRRMSGDVVSLQALRSGSATVSPDPFFAKDFGRRDRSFGRGSGPAARDGSFDRCTTWIPAGRFAPRASDGLHAREVTSSDYQRVPAGALCGLSGSNKSLPVLAIIRSSP